MNRKTAEKIAAIALFAILAIIFYMQNFARAETSPCPGFESKGGCLTIDKQPVGYYDRNQAGLIAFYQVDNSCDSTAPAHTDEYIKGYTDA